MKRLNSYILSEEIINSSTHGGCLAMVLVVCVCFLVKGAATTLAALGLGLYQSRSHSSRSTRPAASPLSYGW